MSAIRWSVALFILLSAGSAPGAETAERSGTSPATSEIRLADATIELSYTGDAAGLDRNELREWITASANAVQSYYGCFPVKRVRIRIEAGEGRGARSGTTYAYNGALIRVGVGRYSDSADLKRDWIMTHEMVHLAMPEFADRYAWLEEGLATYVEPIARVQVGQLTEEKIWRDMLQDMPKGLPAAGDQGLDNTHTWGRTYWGGALFYLLADVRIRERTGNRAGLQDALRAIVAHGGNVEVSWDVRRTLAMGDQATGTKVLIELYDEMRATPVSPDLAQLWLRLGVKLLGDGVEFDDAAPLAAIRRAITAKRGA
ncbi:MAG: hypothetical protein HY067_12110 [Betaproteobacteria bacterium]|nr:hypothetical protein [Betaproteobacteria bacterium]